MQLQRTLKAVVSTAISLTIIALVYFVFMSPYKVYIVHTGSMAPTIPTRSIVIVHEGQYHVGQVITFTVGDEPVTHRLVGIRSDGRLITKGDGNRSVDPWRVTKSNIIGGVVAAPREIGFWLYFLARPYGIIFGLLVVLFVYSCWDTEKPSVVGSSSAAVPA